ncbi:MAG TPA: hypothetical protein VM223_11870, partial [Planctomycetota bacterium]|nr:hypothetical protein [Planctomycetota bacterium]
LPASMTGKAQDILSKTIGDYVQKFIISQAKTYGKEVGEEVIQAGIRLGVKALAVGLSGDVPGLKDIDWEAELQNVLRQGYEAALALPFMMLPGGVSEFRAEAQDIRAKNFLLTPEGTAEFIRQAPDMARSIAAATDPNGPSRKDLADVIKPTDRWSKEERKQFADTVRQQLATQEKQNAGTVRSDQAGQVEQGPQPAGEPAGGGGNVQPAPVEGGGAHGTQLRTESTGAPAQAPADVQQGKPTAPAPAELTPEETRTQVEAVLARAPELKGATLRETGKKGELVLTLPGGRRAKVKLATENELRVLAMANPKAYARSLVAGLAGIPELAGKQTVVLDGVEVPVPTSAEDFLSGRFTDVQRNQWQNVASVHGTFLRAPEVDADGTLVLAPNADLDEVSHEVVHWFIHNGLISDHEFNAVLDHAGFEGDRASRAAGEAFAYAYQDFRANRLVNPPSAVSETFQRIADFLAALAGHAGARARQTMRTIESGKAAARPGVATTQPTSAQAEAPSAPQPLAPAQPQPAPTAPSAPTKPAVAAETGLPEGREFGTVYGVEPSELSVDPHTFQYKSNVNEQGVTQDLASVQKWDSTKAGVIAV